MGTEVKIQVFNRNGLWIALLPTPYGPMELLCGTGDEPDVRTIALIERFFEGPEDHLADIRRSALSFPKLWRPIRFAVNNQDRLGVQYKHKITGKQVGIFFADEHSAFKQKRGDIQDDEADQARLSPVEPA